MNDQENICNRHKGAIPNAFAFSSSKRSVLKNSSSGGAFSVLAAHIIHLGGIVFGAKLDPDGHVIHDKAETLSEIRPLTKSKYAQSKLGTTFLQCKEALLSGRRVLYTGTPCQINALHTFLDIQGVNKERLLSADVICHGTPRSWIWERYLQEIGYIKGQGIDFRYKRPSWEDYSFKVGNHIHNINEDPYFWLFLSNYSLAESCFSCKCKGENRRSDITLGDFWGVNNVDARPYKKLGVSIIIVRQHSDLITDIFGSALKPVPYAPSIMENSSYYLSAKKPEKYEEFYKALETKTIEETAVFLGMDVPKRRHWYSGIRGRLAQKTVYPKSYLLRKAPFIKRNKKIGIISDFGYGNFGNKLQNYALRTFIEKEFGRKCVNIVFADNPKSKESSFHLIYRMLRHPKSFFVLKSPYQQRMSAIKKTSKQYENNFIYHRRKRAGKKICELDKIFFGSDQIWNYDYHIHDLPFNLGFLGIEKMQVPLYTYAASIGKEKIEDRVRPLFDEGLRHFQKISVREQTAVNLLHKEFGINAQLCLDPTLLLSGQEWKEAIKTYSSKKMPKEPFALLYVFEEKEQKESIKRDLKNRGLKYIDLFDQNDDYYVSNQFDFINLIAHAKELHTNSFHGVVFALLFHIPFSIYKRELFSGAQDRMETLLNICNLKPDFGSNKQLKISGYLENLESFQRMKSDSKNYLEEIL